MSKYKETHSLFFQTPIWSTEKPEWVKETNKVCQPYLDEAHQRHSEKIKKNCRVVYEKRRAGDVDQVYSNINKFNKTFKWKPKHNDIKKILLDKSLFSLMNFFFISISDQFKVYDILGI